MAPFTWRVLYISITWSTLTVAWMAAQSGIRIILCRSQWDHNGLSRRGFAASLRFIAGARIRLAGVLKVGQRLYYNPQSPAIPATSDNGDASHLSYLGYSIDTCALRLRFALALCTCAFGFALLVLRFCWNADSAISISQCRFPMPGL